MRSNDTVTGAQSPARRSQCGESTMRMTKEMVQAGLDALPESYRTKDVDALIMRYVKNNADVSALRGYVLTEQQFHRIYFYVTLDNE